MEIYSTSELQVIYNASKSPPTLLSQEVISRIALSMNSKRGETASLVMKILSNACVASTTNADIILSANPSLIRLCYRLIEDLDDIDEGRLDICRLCCRFLSNYVTNGEIYAQHVWKEVSIENLLSLASCSAFGSSKAISMCYTLIYNSIRCNESLSQLFFQSRSILCQLYLSSMCHGNSIPLDTTTDDHISWMQIIMVYIIGEASLLTVFETIGSESGRALTHEQVTLICINMFDH